MIVRLFRGWSDKDWLSFPKGLPLFKINNLIFHFVAYAYLRDFFCINMLRTYSLNLFFIISTEHKGPLRKFVHYRRLLINNYYKLQRLQTLKINAPFFILQRYHQHIVDVAMSKMNS